MQLLVIQPLTALQEFWKPANGQTLTTVLLENDFSIKRISNMTKENPPILP